MANSAADNRKKHSHLTIDDMVDILRFIARDYSHRKIAEMVKCNLSSITQFINAARTVSGDFLTNMVSKPYRNYSDRYLQRVNQAIEDYRAAYGTLKLPPLDIERHERGMAGSSNSKKAKRCRSEKAEACETVSTSKSEQVTFSEAEPDTTDDKGWLTTSTLISVEAHGVYADVAGSEQALTVTVGTVQFQMSAAQLKGFASELLKVVEALGVSE